MDTIRAIFLEWNSKEELVALAKLMQLILSELPDREGLLETGFSRYERWKGRILLGGDVTTLMTYSEMLVVLLTRPELPPTEHLSLTLRWMTLCLLIWDTRFRRLFICHHEFHEAWELEPPQKTDADFFFHDVFGIVPYVRRFNQLLSSANTSEEEQALLQELLPFTVRFYQDQGVPIDLPTPSFTPIEDENTDQYHSA